MRNLIILISLLSSLVLQFKIDAQNKSMKFSCSNIETLDLPNASIPIASEGTTIKFDSGKACPINEYSGICDWEYTITTDRILHPNSDLSVRLLIINRNHLTGSGAWDHLNLYICENGNLKAIFEKAYLYGAKLDFKNDSQFVVRSGQWQDNDPTCCPSQEKEELFLWNSREQKYTVVNSKLSKVS